MLVYQVSVKLAPALGLAADCRDSPRSSNKHKREHKVRVGSLLQTYSKFLSSGQQKFSVNGQTVSIFDFAGHMVSIETALLLYHGSSQRQYMN